ncbi:DUF2842 domain-containing protein [Oceaniglobus roseus]|uniref:DUF2842 domain-containing protein n=1 Tax=Oceaniglobus roseus TaxID=1737570 RepID=UPI000C7F7524|nr:DUF2842 domain-containing protein [Kandeliimicrobium roseum]
MTLSYKARRRWALVILLIGLPVYVLVASWLATAFGRQNLLVELLIYVVLGVVWALPFRFIFKGIGQADPDARR